MKSQQCLKLRIFELRFLRFFESRFKKRKVTFLYFQKNVKNVFSNYVVISCHLPPHSTLQSAIAYTLSQKNSPHCFRP